MNMYQQDGRHAVSLVGLRKPRLQQH